MNIFVVVLYERPQFISQRFMHRNGLIVKYLKSGEFLFYLFKRINGVSPGIGFIVMVCCKLF
jgi:hypothetical protein